MVSYRKGPDPRGLAGFGAGPLVDYHPVLGCAGLALGYELKITPAHSPA